MNLFRGFPRRHITFLKYLPRWIFLKNYKVQSHPIISTRKLCSELILTEIQCEEKLTVINGYHKYGTKWWTNTKCPYSFKYMALDRMCAPGYFEIGEGHPSYEDSQKLYLYMQETYSLLFGDKFSSVIELGTGGGEITRHFHENSIEFLAVEGTEGGVDKLKSIGIPNEMILKRNLKFLETLDKRFDLAMCTEVAEHIEPWFASKIVSNCIEHSDVVWFSAAKGSEPPHYHHINEVPLHAWDNIFAHFGYNKYIELNGTTARADRLYLNSNAASRLKSF